MTLYETGHSQAPPDDIGEPSSQGTANAPADDSHDVDVRPPRRYLSHGKQVCDDKRHENARSSADRSGENPTNDGDDHGISRTSMYTLEFPDVPRMGVGFDLRDEAAD